MLEPVKPALARLSGRRRWALALAVIAFAWALRGFIALITPGNPNPYITPLAVMTTAIAGLAPLITSARFGRSRMADVTLALASILIATGAALQLGPSVGDARRVALAAHMIGGVAVLLPVHLYLVGHLGEALRRRPVDLVRGGVVSLAVVLICVWSGALITFVQAREMEPLVTPHWVTGWALVALVIAHGRRGRAVLAARETPTPVGRRLLIAGVLPGVGVLVLAAILGGQMPDAGPWEAPGDAFPTHQASLTGARTVHDAGLSAERWNWEPSTCSSPGGYCHVDNVTQWKRSAHARSANPAYAASLARLEETRPGATAYCAGCHEPRAALSTGEYAAPPPPSYHEVIERGVDGTLVSDGATGRATTIPPVAPGVLGEGVGCQVCHLSTPRTGDAGHTGGYVMAPTPADLVRTAAVPFFNFPMVLADLDRHRGLLLGDSLLGGVAGCATCHVHHVPDSVHPAVPGLVVADHRSPFESSPAAADGGTCVDCHMPRIYGPLDPTWTRSHAFPSGNTGVPWLLDLPERVAESQAFLQDDAVELTLDCALVEAETRCTITVHNVGVGHDFPAGPRDLVEVWVELVAEGHGARWVQGALGADGVVGPTPLTFRELLFDSAGQRLDLHEFWLAARTDGIPSVGPGGTREQVVVIPIAPPLSVTARLRHRRYTADFVRAAFGSEHAMAPVTDIASAAAVVP